VNNGIFNDPDFIEATSHGDPSREANLSELQKKLNESMLKLSHDHRAVVTMFDIQGMPHAEISKVLKISEGTVRSRLFYAHRQLQNYLQEFINKYNESIQETDNIQNIFKYYYNSSKYFNLNNSSIEINSLIKFSI
jgi:ABC-type oligopeptide transport system ATPase subunit